MPGLFGFILGVILTIAGAYLYDSSTGRAPNGLSTAAAGGQAPLVNWDIVANDWHSFTASVRASTDNLEQSLRHHSG